MNKFTELERFAWEAYKHGENTHVIAMPTQAHKLQEVFKSRQEEAKEEKKEQLLTKYGGAEHLQVPDVILRAETEEYIEYSRDGRVIKGRERVMVQSKYMKDIHPGNHSSVWGSWFCTKTMQWGYRCCKQTHRQAYCTADDHEAECPRFQNEAPAAPPEDAPSSPKALSPKGVALPPVEAAAAAAPPAASSPPKVPVEEAKASKKRKKEESSDSSSDSDS